MFHEAGHYFAAKRAGMKVTEFFFGFGPRIWSFQRGETEYGAKAFPLGGYVRIIGMNNLEEVDPEDEPRTYRQGTFGNRMVVVLAGVTVNILLAALLFFVAYMGQGRPDGISTTLQEVVVDTPAAEGGLEAGDRLVAIGGQRITDWDEVPDVLENRAGVPTTFIVERDGVEQTIVVTPEERSATDSSGYVGISPEASFESLSIVGAARESVDTLVTGTKGTALALARLVSPSGIGGQVDSISDTPPASGSTEDLERPRSIIGIVDIGGRIVDGNIWALIFLLGAINLALGLFNLIPLLPFDGGHAAIAVYEQTASVVQRRRVRVDFRRLMPVTALVLAFFLILMLSTAFLDLRDIFTR
jgi:membrane-associated protease RseP (regulator of RpoE activity)